MQAKKAFGQHFLHDRGVLAAIVRTLDPREGEAVVEIGPGTGRLTAALLEVVAAERLVAIEQDRDMIARLAEKLPALRVLTGDAARFDFDPVLPALSDSAPGAESRWARPTSWPRSEARGEGRPGPPGIDRRLVVGGAVVVLRIGLWVTGPA